MGKGHLYKGSGVVAADSSNSVSVKLAGTSASEGAWLVNLGFFPSEAEWHKQTLELREETVAIHLHDVKNIPSLDIMSPSDPYVGATQIIFRCYDCHLSLHFFFFLFLIYIYIYILYLDQKKEKYNEKRRLLKSYLSLDR